MANNDQPLTLKITAASSIHKEADVVWSLTLTLNDRIVAEDSRLVDPYSVYEAAECKWYLEDFASVSPYETERARKVSRDIGRYGRSLVRQLRLGELMNDLWKGDGQNSVLLEIFVEESGHSAPTGEDSVHRLFWECLENVDHWGVPNPPRCVVVQRRILYQADHELSAPGRSRGPETPFSVLLVTARDCSTTVTRAREIDPYEIASILLDMRRTLSDSAHPATLAFEIVRPGTYSAFKSHLSSKFDLVHFDLHGKIGKQKGKNVAYLQFAAEDSPERLASVSAGEVATLLREHSISLVILNSCKSAQTGGGDDANLAKTFVDAGISNVLAMSMSVSETAASLFVRGFYSSLILRGFSFARSVCGGRETLRQRTQRPARFGGHVEVQDWLVPVLYTCERDSSSYSLKGAYPSVQNPDINLQQNGFEYLDAGSALLPGRHFDILRLERHLIQYPFTLLTGRSGIGKTALLQTLKTLWELSEFVEKVVYIDFTSKKFDSMESIATEILLQLGLLGSTDTLASENELNVYLEEDLIGALVGRKCALLLDGLHNSHSPLPEHVVPTKLSDMTRVSFNKLISEVVRRPTNAEEYQPRIVLAGRRADVTWWNTILEPAKFQGETLYHLEGLDMEHALPLARQLAITQGAKSEDASVAESDSLEILVRLFQGNPLSMRVICPYVNVSGRNDLNELMFASIPAAIVAPFLDPDITFMSELRHLSEVMPGKPAIVWRSLSLFWQEGPIIEIWTDSVSELGNPELGEQVEFALQVAVDRGLIECTLGQISWIHPLFTIYLRLLFPVVSDQSEEARQVVEDVPGVLIKELFGPLDKAKTLQKYTTDAIQTWLLIMAEIDRELGNRFEAICVRLKGAIFNAFTCIRACGNSPSDQMQLANCPLNAISYYTPFTRQILLKSELLQLTELFKSVIDRLTNEFPSLAIPPDYQMLALQTLNHQTAVHKSEMRGPFTEVMEYSDKCVALIKASEGSFGPIKGFHELWHKSLCFKYRAFFLLEELREEEAEAAWNAMTDVDQVIFDEILVKPESANPSLDDSTWSNIGSGPSRNIQEAKTRDIPNAWRELKHRIWTDLKVMIAAARGAESRSNLTVNSIVDFTDSSRALLGVSEAFKDLGVQGFSTDPRWWPKRHDLNKHFTLSQSRTARMCALETARSNGSWMEAAGHHLWLADNAQREADIDVALHHLQDALAIREMLNGADEEIPVLQKRAKVLEHLQEFSKLAKAVDQDSFARNYNSASEGYERLTNFLASMDLGSNELTTQIRDQVKAEIDQQKLRATTGQSLSDDGAEVIGPEEAGRRYRNYEAIYTQIGRQIGFSERNASSAEYNKHMQNLLKSVGEENIENILHALNSMLEIQKTPLFVALRRLPEWSKQFKETENLHTQLLRGRAVHDEKWEEAMSLTDQLIEGLDTDAPEDVRQYLYQELQEYDQNRIKSVMAVDALRVKANEDQNWETAIDLTECMLARSKTLEAQYFLEQELETTRINMYHHGFRQAASSNDTEAMLESMRALRQIAELQQLPQRANTSSAEKLDLADIIKTIEFIERMVEEGRKLEHGVLEYALIAALSQFNDP
ncbi:hypothetical protein MMC11_007601 [Xylographa trunciseda]|nr:hypothetical protein [Xylographa trunciseda]